VLLRGRREKAPHAVRLPIRGQWFSPKLEYFADCIEP
jgi:hypothetical protein